ncbi:MAG: hypothetical protein ABIH26_04220 [Candidatus Eisenbacteria bacterium]
MRNIARGTVVLAVGLFLLFPPGGASAGAGCGAKSGVQKAGAGSDCGFMKTGVASSCAGMQEGSAGCSQTCGAMKTKSGQALLCPTSGKVLATVQLVETGAGFRLYAVGCKKTGRDFLERSARVLDSMHEVRGSIHEGSDGLFMDAEGNTAKKMVRSWQAMAKSGKGGCLLVTSEGECLLDAVSLAPAVG